MMSNYYVSLYRLQLFISYYGEQGSVEERNGEGSGRRKGDVEGFCMGFGGNMWVLRVMNAFFGGFGKDDGGG